MKLGLLTVFANAVLAFPDLIENLNLHTFQKWDSTKYNFEEVHGLTEIEFLHGIASGDPTTDSIILWTRVTPNLDPAGMVPVYLKVSESPYLENGTTYSILTDSTSDFTVKVDVKGLEPNKHYYYQFYSSNGESTRIGRTRTLPEENYTDEIKLGVYSCSNYAGGFFTAYSMPAIKDSVDFVIHLGDYIYEHENGVYTNGTSIGRVHMPDREMWKLDDYRERYASYHLDSDLQLSHAMFPWILVWDDHEIADNSWLRGSVNSLGWDFLARKEAGVQAYFEWLPIRPQTNIYKVWRELKFGKLLDLLMLDTRHYSRDVTDIYTNTNYIAAIADKEERTMMGFDQEKWLYDSLKNSDAAWKVIGSQTVVDHVDFSSIGKIIGPPFETLDYDTFDGYTANRDRLLGTIESNNISDVVIISGDFHIAWTHELFTDVNKYNKKTGEGAIAVEFATTAASSPTTFPKDYNVEQCYAVSKTLVDHNNGLLWNEAWFRGYFELKLTLDEVKAEFFGVNVTNSDHEEYSLAEFAVDRGISHVRRDFNGPTPYGYLDPKVL